MNIVNQYSPVVEDIASRVGSLPMKELESFDTVYWHGDESKEPEDGPYEPTGYPKLDALVRSINPRVKYGGDEACNTVIPFLANLLGTNNDSHFMELPHASDFNSPEHYAMVLSHELIHWATIRDPNVPESGISRNEGAAVREGGLMPPNYAIDEMSADIGAILLMKWAGVPNPEDDTMIKRIHATQSHTSPFPVMRDAAMMVAKKRALHQFVRLLDMSRVNFDEPDYGSDA